MFKSPSDITQNVTSFPPDGFLHSGLTHWVFIVEKFLVAKCSHDGDWDGACIQTQMVSTNKVAS